MYISRHFKAEINHEQRLLGVCYTHLACK